MNIIEFKGLGIRFSIDPVAIQLGPLPIHWYGIIISLAFLIGYFIAMRFAKKEKFNQDVFLDMILISAPIAIICARIYYVIFRFDEYRYDLWEIPKIWHGGIAIYGAIIGAVATVIVYCKVKKLNVWQVLDIAAPSFAIGQAIGRWGNFVNVEAYGRTTDLPWAMTILENGVYKSVHPTFLYESLWNLLVFIILLYFYKRKRNNGEVFTLYIGLYSLGRFWIEGLRTDSLYWGEFRISQVLAIILVTLSAFFFIFHRKSVKRTMQG